MTATSTVLVAGAGVLAGILNTVGGGGTLLAYPALLAGGLGPIAANVTSAVGLVPGYAGGALAYRRELAGQIRRTMVLLPALCAGSLAGCALLLITPASSFDAVVPYLVLVSSVLFAVQPSVRRLLERRGVSQSRAVVLHAALFLTAAYGAFFGAGLGVLLLAVLGLTTNGALQRLNAQKSALSLLIVLAAAIVYCLRAPVDLRYTAVLMLASALGGFVGGVIALRIDPRMLRIGIVVLGVCLAVLLLLT